MDDRDALGLQTEDAGEANNVEDGGYVIEEGVYILSNTTFHQASWRQILYFLSLCVHMFEMAKNQDQRILSKSFELDTCR